MKYKYIEVNSKICGGKPVFKQTRIPIYVILDFLSAGETVEEILKNYPQLTKEHIKEAIRFASDLAKYGEEEPVEIFAWWKFASQTEKKTDKQVSRKFRC